jgi:hypothetical protein
MNSLRYTNAVLTVIALCLALLVVKDVDFGRDTVHAQTANNNEVRFPPQAVWIVGSSATLPVYTGKDPTKR